MYGSVFVYSSIFVCVYVCLYYVYMPSYVHLCVHPYIDALICAPVHAFELYIWTYRKKEMKVHVTDTEVLENLLTSNDVNISLV